MPHVIRRPKRIVAKTSTVLAAAIAILAVPAVASAACPSTPTKKAFQAFGDSAGHSGGIEDRRPASDQSGGELARDAGINDIGSSGRRADNDSGSRQGFFDQASHDDDDTDHDSDGFDGDDGGDDSDYA